MAWSWLGGLGLVDAPIGAVAQAQDHGGEEGSAERAGQYRNLDVVVAVAADSEGQFPDE